MKVFRWILVGAASITLGAALGQVLFGGKSLLPVLTLIPIAALIWAIRDTTK